MSAPDLQRTPHLYRATLACKIGRDSLEGKARRPLPGGVLPHEYALYNLLHAVEEIAAHLAEEATDER